RSITFIPIAHSSTTAPLFSFTHPSPTAIYTLSLHDALPISALRTAIETVPVARAELPSTQMDLRLSPSGSEEREPSNTTLALWLDRKSTRLNSSHLGISYAVFCLKKKKTITEKEETTNRQHK